MLRNYLKIALRNLRRQKGYAFINIAGLAVGIACCLLIVLHVYDELSYDRYHEHADRIYRLTIQAGIFGEMPVAPAPTAPALSEHYPEVERFTRMYRRQEVLRQEEEYMSEERFFYADSSVFEVFTYPLLSGNPRTALREPNTVVLTASTARRYFGDEEALGRSILLRDGTPLRVTGIAADLPSNTHLHFDFLASFASLDHNAGEASANPWRYQGFTYLLLTSPEASASLQAKLDTLTSGEWQEVARVVGWGAEGFSFGLQPLTSIHLHSHTDTEVEPTGDIRYLYLFSAVAAFVLLIACINYMNLATARSLQRTREVGVRKVLGAQREQLVRQFLSESFLLTLLALILAIVCVEALLPVYNWLTGKEMGLDLWQRPEMLVGLALVVLIVGLGAGAYPALFLSHFRPALVLKGGVATKGGTRVRRALVTFQFAVSVALMAGTLVIQRQLDYIQTKHLGFDTEQILLLPVKGTLEQKKDAFKQELLALPGVQHVSISSGSPNLAWGITHEHDGIEYPLRGIHVDADYLDAMGMELVAGRDFDPALASDSASFIVNETAARLLGLEDKVGEILETPIYNSNDRLIGIVSDFHIASLREPIGPAFLRLASAPDFMQALVVRLEPNRIPETLQDISGVWRRFAPDFPFDYDFLDEMLREQYEAEKRLAITLGAFALVAILVACLGLFGLAAFTAESRTKEIGIRKVLGASIGSIVALLSKEFARLVILAALVTVPIVYLAMNRWLEDFAYRIEIGPGIFLLAGAFALLTALATVSYQAVKAALADPVKSLRYE